MAVGSRQSALPVSIGLGQGAHHDEFPTSKIKRSNEIPTGLMERSGRVGRERKREVEKRGKAKFLPTGLAEKYRSGSAK